MSNIIDLFPFAAETKDEIEQQNKYLKKVSLTGKINALKSSENLFKYTDKTIEQFDVLKVKLTDALVAENINKITNELYLKAQLSIDVLKRNLFERTADVGFLSQDYEIIKFLLNQQSEDTLKIRLTEYIKKYSVYDDVIIFDINFQKKININSDNHVHIATDNILQQALENDTYIEKFGYTDICPHKDNTLIYAQKIVHNNKDLGVLCLSFKFDDELRTIFHALCTKNDLIYLEQNKQVIASSNQNLIKKDERIQLTKNKQLSLYKQNKIAVQTSTKGYQGYFGLDWKCTAISLKNDIEFDSSNICQTLPKNLQDIINEAHEIVDDLADVIINGELIASKFRQYTLSPILENLRTISGHLLESINSSATILSQTITQSLLNNAKLTTKFSIDLMDRNLYERANDCRWWALTTQFKEELSKSDPNSKLLSNILKDINELYTVYTNLFIYNKKGKIIAASHDQSIIGNTFKSDILQSVLYEKDTQKYFVTSFETTSFYENRPTYIYNAAINSTTETVGGIAIVFDSEPEFKAILKDSALKDKKGFSLFCRKNKQIIASTSKTLEPLEYIDLPNKFFELKEDQTVQDYYQYENKNYLVTAVHSNGYREYKQKDNYTNDIIAISLIEIV